MSTTLEAIAAREAGLDVDMDAFNAAMQEQRERAKADAKAKKSGHATTEVWKELRALGETEWKAYEALETEGSVVGIVSDGVQVQEVPSGSRVQVVLAWMRANAHWIAARIAVEFLGEAAILKIARLLRADRRHARDQPAHGRTACRCAGARRPGSGPACRQGRRPH